MRTANGLRNPPQDIESPKRAIPLEDLPESELIRLLHRLEELAQIEGLREKPTVLKIPPAVQQEIDNKAEDNEVVKHDGTVPLSADWDIGDGHKIEADEIAARDGAGLKLYDDGGNGIFVKDGGYAGFGTAIVVAPVDVVNSSWQIRATDSLVDNTVKHGGFISNHYDIDEQDIMIISSWSGNGKNDIVIGGRSTVLNAATEIQFWTAANSTTLTGAQRVTIDKSGNMGRNTATPNAGFDNNGTTRLGDSTTNYAAFAADGEMTLHGTARVKKQLILHTGVAKLPGANFPTAAIVGEFSVLQFSQAVTQNIYFTFHVPNDWDSTTDISIKVYWAPTDGGAGDVVWDLDYLAVAPNVNEVLTTGAANLSITDSAESLQDELFKSGNLVLPAAALAYHDAVSLHLYRDTGDGADTYAASASFVYLEVEYVSDRHGEAT